jgi:allantoate deiminase
MSYNDSATQVIKDLREFAEKTSNERGAQRVAWGPVWRDAREWFKAQVKEIGLDTHTDAAGNLWASLEGESDQSIIIGSHLDSVPCGGWLDGCLGVIAGIEILRRYAKGPKPPVTIRVVDWADEEGARFGRSLLGSSASAGTLEVDTVGEFKDRNGIKCVDALKENDVILSEILDAHTYLKSLNGIAYLELHIEQGPVLESLDKPTGVVIGTFGVERQMIRFKGQAAHSGSTPLHLRRDAFLAGAETAIAIREIGRKYTTPEAAVVCTVGVVNVGPKFVTAVPGFCEISLDQRALSAETLAKMNNEAREASIKIAEENNVEVEWEHLWKIDPRPFDEKLLALCDEAVMEETGQATRLPSGPLHDAAEMVPFMPTIMVFAQSSPGLSHCKEEDTKEDDLHASIRSFLNLMDKVVASS